MRIAIVNDLLMATEALRRVIITVPNYQLAWVAQTGVEAVEKAAADTPDLILMDLVMPCMDGVEATRQIMLHSPCAILLVTATVNGLGAKVFEAMGYGALDAINTPIFELRGQAESGSQLLKKIDMIAKLIGKSARKSPLPRLLPPLIVIGASTGGPEALNIILSQFPKNLLAAVVVIQHVDAEFAPGLANWLNQQTSLEVKTARSGDRPEPGKVLIAGTNDHLILGSDLTLTYATEPQDCFYRPSVDIFFKSVAKYWQHKGVGILLTGMGKDGAAGLMTLKSHGWYTIAQEQASCVVYGMPKAAAELGAAVKILPVEAIAKACMKHIAREP